MNDGRVKSSLLLTMSIPVRTAKESFNHNVTARISLVSLYAEAQNPSSLASTRYLTTPQLGQFYNWLHDTIDCEHSFFHIWKNIA